MQDVNPACINVTFSRPTLFGMHESMKRLLDFARESTKNLRQPDRIGTFADVAGRLGVSSAVMTNWKARGISKDGALDAQRVLGCNAWWLLDGDPPERLSGWPFPRVQQARWDACSAEDRAYVQGAVNKALDECESMRGGSQSKETMLAA